MFCYPKIVQSSKISPYSKPLRSVPPITSQLPTTLTEQLQNSTKNISHKTYPNYMSPLQYTKFSHCKTYIINKDPYKNKVRSDVRVKSCSKYPDLCTTSSARIDPSSFHNMCLKLNAQKKHIFQKPYIVSRRDPHKNKTRTDVQFMKEIKNFMTYHIQNSQIGF